MTANAKRKLARKINRAPAAVRNAPSSPWVVATVTAISLGTNSLTVEMQGDTTAISGISFMDSYMPVLGDVVTLVRIKGHLWVVGSVAGAYQPYVGPGANTNILTGGANRTNTEPYQYFTSAVLTVAAGSGWSFSTTGESFNGVGYFSVTPGDNAGTLGYLTVIMSNCLISAGNMTLAGAAFQSGSTSGVTASSHIRVNVQAVAW